MDFSVSISVVMSTYNTDLIILKEAVESILNQTFSDFEFIIIDDGSTNETETYLNSITDKRVIIIRNPENIGLTKSLNIGLKEAKGKYIARMDDDDISLPTRFEKEFAYMEAHTDVVLCGTNTILFSDGKIIPTSNPIHKSEKMGDYRVRMLFINPGPMHPTMMIRHEQLIKHHLLYDEKLICAQDYGMLETISHFGRIYVIDEVLVHRRKHENQITLLRRDTQRKCDKMTQKKMLSALLGEVSDEEVDLHYFHSTGYFPDAVINPEISEWYDRLLRANKEKHIYDQKKLKKHIIIIKKYLIRQTLNKTNYSTKEKINMIFQYLPFFAGIRFVLGNIKRKL